MTFEEFCGSAFWDEHKTWNTTNPDFTPCFQKTVLIGIPCIFLLIFTPFQFRFIKRQERRFIPWTIFNGMKLFCCLTLVVCNLFHLLYTLILISDYERIYPIDCIYLWIEQLTYLFILILNFYHIWRGIHSSSLLLCFWLLQAVSSGIRYRSIIMKAVSENEIVDTVEFSITAIKFPFIISQVILSCFADTIICCRHGQKNSYPMTHASPVNAITYSFFDSLAWKGFRRPLIKDDLWALSKRMKAEEAFTEYDRIEKSVKLKNYRKTSTKDRKIKHPSLSKIIWHMIKWEFIALIIIKYIGDVLSFVSPLMLKRLINFVSNDEPKWKGILYSIILFLSQFGQMLFSNFHFYGMQIIGMRIRAAIISAIYRKTLRISSEAKRSSTIGEIVTLMSVDAQRLMDLWQHIGFAFSLPIQMIIVLIFVWDLLGISFLAGLVVIVLVIPINGYVVNKSSKLQRYLMRQKDKRTKLINEILGGMKILKLYAWEMPFYNEITKIRSEELVSLKKILLLQALTNFFLQCTPVLISLSTFVTYVLSDPANILDAATAFVSLSIFEIIRVPLNFAAMSIAIFIQSYVSVKRINAFMSNEDLDPNNVFHEYEAYPVVIKDGSFSWSSDAIPILQSINFKVSSGQLVAIIGSVGAGKSSLISCLLGEMRKMQGYVNTKGTVAYVPQQAWIQNHTLQENITFGKAFDAFKYRQIIEACALQPDIEVLPAGDLTEIGEKGINLSGGQKQRISLARAVYSNGDIFLLDDPLSSVDAHVGKYIFENIIGPNGLLKHKTRIFVTHGICYLPCVDLILMLDNKSIVEMGSYKSLIQANGAFADFILNYLNEKEQLQPEKIGNFEEIQKDVCSVETETKQQLTQKIDEILNPSEELLLNGLPTPNMKMRKYSEFSSTESLPQEHFGKCQLIQEEHMETGKVDWAVYYYYIKSVGIIWFCIMFFALALSWSSSFGSNIWLSFWSDDQPLSDGLQDIALRDLRLGVYGTLIFGQTLFSLIALAALTWGAIRASTNLHNYMLMSVLRCPMSFFETIPLGRIVNRFSRDVDATDYTVPCLIYPVLDCFFQIIGTVIVISLGTPIFLIIFIPLGITYYFIQRLYIDSSRQLKRLESVSRSPIYSHFSETISGIMTVRAYKLQNSFIQCLENKVDENHIIYYPILIAKRWLSVRLEVVGEVVILLVSLFAVIERENLHPGFVGLSINYSLSVTYVLKWLVRNWTDLESNIVSVERMKEYSELESESEWYLDSTKPTQFWPDKGEVQFQAYSTRYREGLDFVLKRVSCDIHSKEKIGIIGRTGSGKSSLSLSLFRIIEAAEGCIKIDGIDISHLGLQNLRSRLTIIPQDPVIFCGTLRLNIDPFGRHNDDEIWKVLEHSHLKEFVSSLPAALEYEILEGGENLSVGQRQLVCLARALLRKTKILVLDEATASVDLETDDLIQATIRKEFADCTVLTIAHRLITIMESDRVMVLDKGFIKEFDSPKKLLQNKDSIFYSMAKDAGLI